MKTFRDSLGRSTMRVVGFMGMLAGVSGVALADFGFSPEIDPGSMVNALLVLSGSVLIVTGRRPRK